jgi:4-amino-4-deoxy-L-arabinose transferase-like glycosyltransferase
MNRLAQPSVKSGQDPFLRWWGQARSSPFWLIAVAFGLRLAYILIAHAYRIKPDQDFFSFGYEMGRIGRALATGHGFSDPFGPHTGPTAWEPPLYPCLIAAAFKFTGVYTATSAFILLSLNSLFSALTCVPIFLMAQKCFSERVAVWSAWGWALLPTVMYWCARWVWETSLSALLLALIFWLTLRLRDLSGSVPWITFGLLWGVAALTNSSLISFLPASILWALYEKRKLRGSWIREACLSAIFFAATIAPWTLRNYQTFGKFILVRSNFGAELRLGNGPGADGTWMAYLHPTQNPTELSRYEQLGELSYVDTRKREALDFIRGDYARFIWLSFKRFTYYWAGRPRESSAAALIDNSAFLASSVLAIWGLILALRNRRPGAWLFFWLVLCYPAIYYIVFPHARYRHPIEPELAILIAYVISEAVSQSKPLVTQPELI